MTAARRRLVNSAVILLILAAGGCRRSAPEPADAPHLLAGDPLPADMGVWTCEAYRRAVDGTGHHDTLRRMLAIRPHAFHGTPPPADLVDLPVAAVAGDRRDPLIYRQQLHRDVVASIEGLLAAADGAGLALRVQSAYRSPSYQNLLWKLSIQRFGSDLLGRRSPPHRRASASTAPAGRWTSPPMAARNALPTPRNTAGYGKTRNAGVGSNHSATTTAPSPDRRRPGSWSSPGTSAT